MARHLEKLRTKETTCNFFPIDPIEAGDEGKDTLALALVCRNAAAYIDEWLSFHELAGVRHFYVYDNRSDDGTAAAALRRRAGGTCVSVHPWIIRPAAEGSWHQRKFHVSTQELAYCHAVLNYGPLHRWMAFIDIDEFLVPMKHLTLPEALAQLPASNISLPWFNFGHCGHETMPDAPVVHSYRRRHQLAADERVHVKCVMRTDRIATVGLHLFETTDMGEATVNDRGKRISRGGELSGEDVTNELIQLNHYRTKSIAEHRVSKSYYMHGHDARERKQVLAGEIDRLAQNTCEDGAALDFLSRHGISSAEQFQRHIDGGSK
ncbi:MAG: glycosyltransferase family 92 protein [Betaproteobacteria bacterium AqS2]|uniref:Glycosyltransferase family 92 protein n=1 Tax=Candidatus Amphirhobacter heronislandensis TaxID=1732024 RepID=A0A930XXL9_9GAMM|nr:glycosyltransferase family 92 protein [Betaproteobacteria bacterium AqS2]